ncbi:MAG: glycosyltransferase family 2 protein [Planctomycetota bacterium]|nr:glycosyltransferase family 2 protein [Planctomycetota bacterium]
MPWLSIVIVNWEAPEHLRVCLASLRTEPLGDVEIIVVDNGSRDDSLAVARRACPQAILLALPTNAGFAEGCNRGIATARGTWILTLNNDATVRPGCLESLRAAVAAAPADVGMLQPRVALAGRPRLNSTGVVIHRDGAAHDRDFDAPLDARREADEILCITAGAGLYRRAMLDATRVGGTWFDPTYYMYFEDVDLGWRCRLAGWRATYVPTAEVDHAFQASSRRRARHFVTTHCMRNRVRTLLKNASWRMILRSLPRSASDLLWLLQHAGGRALADWLAAVRDGVRHRPAVTRLLRLDRRAVERRWILP